MVIAKPWYNWRSRVCLGSGSSLQIRYSKSRILSTDSRHTVEPWYCVRCSEAQQIQRHGPSPHGAECVVGRGCWKRMHIWTMSWIRQEIKCSVLWEGRVKSSWECGGDIREKLTFWFQEQLSMHFLNSMLFVSLDKNIWESLHFCMPRMQDWPLYLGHISELCRQWAPLRDEVTSPSRTKGRWAYLLL